MFPRLQSGFRRFFFVVHKTPLRAEGVFHARLNRYPTALEALRGVSRRIRPAERVEDQVTRLSQECDEETCESHLHPGRMQLVVVVLAVLTILDIRRCA